MQKNAQKALELAGDLDLLIRKMIPDTQDLDLQRLLKQVEADMMDVQHKLSMAIKLSSKE